MQVASVGDYKAVTDISIHTVKLCIMARRIKEGFAIPVSESLGSLTWLCLSHECSYMQRYTNFPQFLLRNWFCIETDQNSRLSERKAKQVFTINDTVCTKDLAD